MIQSRFSLNPINFKITQIHAESPNMSDRSRLALCLTLAALVSLLAVVDVQAQSGRSQRGDDGRASSRQFADSDRAANAAREATGGRVLGVQGEDRDGRSGYRVRVLQPDGRVRSLHYDSASGAVRD
jgi:hypothetical protein